MSRILLIGDYSGNNAGHNALLLGIVHEFRRQGASRIFVPSLQPKKLRAVLAGEPGTEPIGVAPWHFGAKFLSPRVFSLVPRVDAVLLTDNQLYDTRLWNPLANNLFTLDALTSWARRVRTPVAYHAGGAGPLGDGLGRKLASRIARRAAPLHLRDEVARRELTSLAPDADLRVTADAVFTLDWEGLARRNEASESPSAGPRRPGRRPVVGVNLSRRSYAPARNGPSRAEATRQTASDAAEPIVRILTEEAGLEVVLVVTHPRDLPAARKVSARRAPGAALEILGPDRFASSLLGLVERLDCLVSDRYHELATFASAGVPVVAWNPGEKIRALFSMLDWDVHLIDAPALANDGPDRAPAIVREAISERARLERGRDRMRRRAREGATDLFETLETR